MMRQSHTNIHPAKESKGNGRQNQDLDEAQWLGSPSDWMRRALCLPSCHAARRDQN
jgi:hypothetical protein